MKKIEFYTTADGKCPYLDWLESLSNEYQVRIDMRLKRVRQGNFGDCRRLQNSRLSELRFDFGKGYRIYYKELDNVIVLLLTGSDKSDQNKVIRLADKLLDEYLNRSNQHEKH